MSVRDTVEIGLNRFARRGYDLDEVSIVPSRRTRDVDDVSTAWQIDAFRFDIPLITSPSDAVVSPATAIAVGQAGGLGVLNGEGLWTRYEDPTPVYREIAAASAHGAPPVSLLQKVYAEPVKTDLIAARIKEMSEGGVTTAIRVSPQHTQQLAPAALSAGVDLLVIQGTIVSAEHVTSTGEALNLKEFIADLDVPVIVGGAANYTTALHLMRTGAAGVIVGVGADTYSTTDAVMGIRVPLASAIADAAAARRDYLDETGGRYVHVIANGAIETSGGIARALACGADAVQLGEPLRVAAEAPAGGVWWDSVAAHPRLPRGATSAPVEPSGSLADVLNGAAESADGRTNLFGALARTMAKTGYRDLKEFQRVDLVIGG
ncbi:GuaB3 family IMP dehydrogenase-related protein [Blastococcus sp. LR1]|uniref:GuaB3 family IMP dehydrogenase-related protein n=1 Tax=Blastococcus sp. LR1 TaxID=2877000 RepID=UPI001CCECF27|nr:GuaB3 family IMP dehydrogenase-related protein [Blastococcus sp. LR1]MCA0146119.1 GuaB3 family IMP dehydrogenase-related protein [Blastococcus sp. LR1]